MADQMELLPVTLKVTFAVLNLRSIPGEITVSVVYDMFRHEEVACNFNYLFENKGLLKVTATFTVNVVISQKRCQNESLLQTTNSN